jgi:TonB-linked SusC/RagA family outer membrane protein
MRKLLRCLPLLALLLCGNAWGQARSVTGTIVSAKDGDGIPNVSILNKTTKKTGLSGNGGFFSIAASVGDVLEFSNVGYFKKLVTISNDFTIKVTLDVNTKKETDVIVTAYGQKKDIRSQGYGSQTLKGEEIAETQRDNWINSLQGKVAGATVNLTGGAPGASSQIVLRGYNSIGGDNTALIVVDGVILNNAVFNQNKLASDLPNRNNDYTNRAADINPDDIESITVLRGPEAAALYGVEAGNGAIIITTKKGKIQKMKLSYDNSFRWEQITKFHEVQKVYDNGFNGANTNTTRQFFGPKYPAGTKFYNNPLNFFNIGKAQTHNVSIDGGKGVTSYRFNGAFYNQEGVIPNTGNKKINFRGTITSKINKKMEISNTVSYNNTFNRKALRGISSINQATGYYLSLLSWPLDDDARRWQNIAGNRRIISKSGGVDNPAEANNPFFETTRNKNFDIVNRVTYNSNIIYNANSWLTFDIRGGADAYTQRGVVMQDREDFSVYTVGGRVETYNLRYMGLNANLLAIARKQVGNFKIKVLLGNAYDDRTTTIFSERGDSLRDEARGVKYNQIDINYASNTANRRLNSRTQGRDTLILQRSVGLFYDINLSYKNLIYLNMSGRNDRLAEFPTQNRSFFYPAFNTSFVFTELIKENNILTLGRLRASYANTGKRVSPYSNQSVYTNSANSTNGYGFGFGFGLNNADLFPETQSTIELGTELKFFKDRLSLDVSAYKINIKNSVAANARPSYATGGILLTSNIADLENKGVEMLVSMNWVKKKKIDWSTRVTFATTRNKVTRLDLPEFYNSDSYLATYRASLFRGQPTTTIGGLDYLRNNAGDILIDPGTGYPLQRPQFTSIGDRNPDFTMGVTNNFRYKNFSIGFTIDIKRGGDVFNGTDLWLTQQGLSKRTLDRDIIRILPGVLQDGLENTANPTRNTIAINPLYQSDYYTGRQFAVDFIEKDIHWLRLRDVSLKYALGKKALKSLKIFSEASLFVTGTDLFIITNYSGVDPSSNGNTPASGGVGGFAIDLGGTPVPIGINVGLRVKFKNGK